LEIGNSWPSPLGAGAGQVGGAGGRRSGLHNLAARALELGGGMCVDQVDGGGTELEWHAPITSM
jgi:signal transduction histidine kinase